MRKKLFFPIALWLLLVGMAMGQGRPVWIFLTDKDTVGYDFGEHLSARALANRAALGLPLRQFSDMPVKAEYVSTLQQRGVAVRQVSKWLNAVSVWATPEQESDLADLSFVVAVEPFRTVFEPTSYVAAPLAPPSYLGAAAQLKPEAFEGASLNGKGVVVGVIDAGFHKADKHKALGHLFENKQILGYRDYVNPDSQNFTEKAETLLDGHGTTVLQMVAGKTANDVYGLASEAKFYLARTDHGSRENRGEEDNWIRALEWMDSLGVRLINTSLGYAKGFDLAEENYTPEQMDGKTSICTKAAQLAVAEKGIILIVSAGNEGDDASWQIITAPADAKGVIAVGATTPNGLKASYSSIGTDKLSDLKPNVACYSSTGTSFSAPVITGFAACLLQAKPDISPAEMQRVIEQSASLYPFGNNYVGYGVPDAGKALALLRKQAAPSEPTTLSAKGAKQVTISHESSDAFALVFHKKDQRMVLTQEKILVEGPNFTLKRPTKTSFSTVLVGGKVIEVIW